MMAANKKVNGTRDGITHGKNPKRVAAGRLNRAKRKGLTAQGRQRLREAALRNRPWRFSTGPKTPEGKAKATRNNKTQQKGPISVRALRGELAGLRELASNMRDTQRLLASGSARSS